MEETIRIGDSESSERKADFSKKFSTTCEESLNDAMELHKLLIYKKHRLSRNLKKAMKDVAAITPRGE